MYLVCSPIVVGFHLLLQVDFAVLHFAMKKFRMRKSKPKRNLPKIRNLISYLPLPAYGAYSVITLVKSYYPARFFRFFSSPVEGAKGLVQFSDIGKQARDLLFTDYQEGLKASLTFDPYMANVKIGNNEQALGSFCLGFRYQILNAQLEYGLDGILKMRSAVELGGLSAGLVASFPDHTSSNVRLAYIHPKAVANFTTTLGLFHNPLLSLSGVFGNHIWSLGLDTSFDVNAQNFRSMNFASSFISDNFTASFNSFNRADLLKVCLHQSIMNSACAVELSLQRSTNTRRISIGCEQRFGSELLLKSRVDSNGSVAGLFQYKWRPGTFYRFSAEVGPNQEISFGLSASFTA